MKKLFSPQVLRDSTLMAMAGVILFGVGIVFAAPTTAPDGNAGVYLPLTVGPTAQTKQGDLSVTGKVTAGQLCFGTDCKSSWSTSIQTGTVSNSAARKVTTYCNPNYGNLYGTNPYGYNDEYCVSSFSYTLPMSIPNGVPIGMAGYALGQCVAGYSQSSYTYVWNGSYYEYQYTTTFYASSYTYPADNVVTSFNLSNGTVTITGSCKYWDDLENNYNTREVAIDGASASVIYLY